MIWLLPSPFPPPPTPSRQQVVPPPQSSCVSPVGEGGKGKDPNHATTRKPGPLYYIQYSLVPTVRTFLAPIQIDWMNIVLGTLPELTNIFGKILKFVIKKVSGKSILWSNIQYTWLLASPMFLTKYYYGCKIFASISLTFFACIVVFSWIHPFHSCYSLFKAKKIIFHNILRSSRNGAAVIS